MCATLTRRTLVAFAGIEALFKVLVGYSYLALAGARTPAERQTALIWFAAVSLPFTLMFFVALARALAPIHRAGREQRAGAMTDATIARAAEALHRLPGRAAGLWTLEWGGTFAVLLACREVTCVEAGVLFFSTMITGPQPVARAVAFWLVAPSMRQASLVARERAITLHIPALPLRRRLAMFGLLIALTPTTYIGSFAFSAQVLHLSLHEMLVPIAMCCAAIVAFAVISASLTAASVTDVVASMAEVIREIARQGDVTHVVRIPQQLRDEVGGLAASINEMIDRLERTAAERAAMSDSLEALNHALERRVHERTTRLFEANAVLQAEMAARAKVEIELRHAQKLEAVGRLAAGIAHEINTPVQFVSDSVEFVSLATTDLLSLIGAYQRAVGAAATEAITEAITAAVAAAEHAADLDYIVAEIPSALALARSGLDRVKDIVRSMKTFAHHDQDMRDADLNAAILSTLTIALHEYKYVADIETELGALPLVYCHAGEINQVVLNLLVNAAHAIADHRAETDARGRIVVRTSVDGDDVVIAVSDTGSGIAEAIQHRIFDPFFTTKDVDRGSGQGLAIARSVVTEKHGGSLTFTTELGIGSTFVIRLPIRGKHARSEPQREPAGLQALDHYIAGASPARDAHAGAPAGTGNDAIAAQRAGGAPIGSGTPRPAPGADGGVV